MRLALLSLLTIAAALSLLAANPAECQDCLIGTNCYTRADCYGACMCLKVEPGSQWGTCASASRR